MNAIIILFWLHGKRWEPTIVLTGTCGLSRQGIFALLSAFKKMGTVITTKTAFRFRSKNLMKKIE
jgi:tRNA (Thr-GGU) A37 N-methylase